MKNIYLDYNATAPLHPDAKKAMLEVMDSPNNPSSIHSHGRDARKIMEEGRRKILKTANGENLVFCGSATEANNLALSQVKTSDASHQISDIAISAIEHESIFKAAPNAKVARVDKNGVVDLDHLEEILASDVRCLVSVMLANNETGVLQPVKKLAAIAKKYGHLVHTDAVQAFGRIKIDFKDLGVDMMTISSHKVGGPVGAAALLIREGLELKPVTKGGGQEKSKRAGTENVVAIVGFAAITGLRFEVLGFRDYLEKEIKKICPETIIHGEKAERLPNTTLVSMPNMDAATQLIAFDMEGISVSSGAACSSGRVEVSRTLTAMNSKLLKNAIRISTGWNTKKEEIEKFLQIWKKLVEKSES